MTDDPLARYMNQPGHDNSANQGWGEDDGASVMPSLGSPNPPAPVQDSSVVQQAGAAYEVQSPRVRNQYDDFAPSMPAHELPAPQQSSYGQHTQQQYSVAPPQSAPQVPSYHAPQQQGYQGYQQGAQPGVAVQQYAVATPVDAGRHRAAMEMASVVVAPSGKLAPERGWRRWLYVLTRINMGLSPDEVVERELHASIRKVVTAPPGTAEGFYLAVLSLKGGVGKTVLTMLLGSIFAIVRGTAALAVDADPDSGNLIDRARKQTEKTIKQLVASADDLSGAIAVREMTNQNEANLEVLAGDDYVDAPAPFSGDDWRTIKEVVQKYYSVVLADCGLGLHTDANRAVLDSAWAAVILCDACVDSAKAAAITVDWLRENGYKDLAARAVIVMNHTKRGKSSADLEDIKARLERQVGEGNVFEMPFDPHIETGGEVDIRLVSSTVRRRATEICAKLSEWFDKPRLVRG
ncbi:MinD/ParA family ATP-binding protein [Mycobacteroides abscessus]|uniref:MinD/ParA family ATP-binding protein n=1 Tax=Mycobacteroides abscessus TaxID=36809 RepID=UPI00266BAD7D|nr:MinD/ParA family protein [Mycobacteroides abscessus]MDO3331495.1 MinD/ParA family protein [Mycobacteroides abscessus subsp. abscessus]